MDLLLDYQNLPQTIHVKQLQQSQNINSYPLNIKLFQAKKIKRLFTTKFNNNHLTFVQNYQNPQTQQERADRQKNDKQNLIKNDNKQNYIRNEKDKIQKIINQQQSQQQDIKKQEQAFCNKRKFDIEKYLNFSLIQKTNQNNYQILINFSLNIKRSTLSFQSKIIKNYRLLRIQSRSLVKFMAKYFLSYNGKLKQGSFYVNPITSQISYFIHNHSCLDSISSLLRNPQKILYFVLFYIDQITLKWNECLDSILYLINKKSYNEINPNKKFKYIKNKLQKINQMIIHSHVDASFFYQNKAINRFKQMEKNQKTSLVGKLINQNSAMQKRNPSINNPAAQKIIQKFIGQKKRKQAQFKYPRWQMSQINQMSFNLNCNQYKNGRSAIYTQIQILRVFNQICIFESGFSKIYQLQAQIKKDQQTAPTKAIIIKKKTQQKRYKNQIQVLKLLQKQNFLFLPRYYFCQQYEFKQNIFIQFIPQSSLDRYLMTKSTFISNQTKLFFLFMIIIALRFLRDHSIVHIDLKPENVLIKIVGDARLNVHYLIKLIDFGQSYSPKINTYPNGKGRGYTIPYAPPQLLSKSSKFDEKADIFSFGVIMYKVMFNQFPTQLIKLINRQAKNRQRQNLQNKQKQRQKSLQVFKTEEYLKYYSIQYEKLQNFGSFQFISLIYYLCLKCLQPNPNDRPTLDWLCIILKDIVVAYDQLTK